MFEVAKTASGYGPVTTLNNFTGGDEGAVPTGGLIADAAGDLFGTTTEGGSGGYGTVFEIPWTASGYGPVTVLASFSGANGADPLAGLIADAKGDLFGTTGFGGSTDDGAVFEIPKTASGYGRVTVLANFNGANGADPEAELMADANGDLFGTTQDGGSNNDGAVFEIRKTASGYGPVTVLANLNGANGADPEAGLMADANGDLFGTTQDGGSNDDGTVFETPKTASGYGPVTVLANFSGANGANPEPDRSPTRPATCSGRRLKEARAALARCSRSRRPFSAMAQSLCFTVSPAAAAGRSPCRLGHRCCRRPVRDDN